MARSVLGTLPPNAPEMMDVDDDGAGGKMDAATVVAAASEAERFALLKQAAKDSPMDYAAHLSLVEFLRAARPGSLDLLKAREA